MLFVKCTICPTKGLTSRLTRARSQIVSFGGKELLFDDRAIPSLGGLVKLEQLNLFEYATGKLTKLRHLDLREKMRFWYMQFWTQWLGLFECIKLRELFGMDNPPKL